jgi:hypothetical protein
MGKVVLRVARLNREVDELLKLVSNSFICHIDILKVF